MLNTSHVYLINFSQERYKKRQNRDSNFAQDATEAQKGEGVNSHSSRGGVQS